MKLHEDISERMRTWLLAQPMFFVGSAPSALDGHVNVSPKGMAGTFAVLGPLQVAYLDYTGSGAETMAHLRENGRIVLMFCAFDGPPQIVRLYGTGRPVFCDDPDFGSLRTHFARDGNHGVRAIIDVQVTRVTDSCGYSVPKLALVQERQLLEDWAARKSPEQLTEYRRKKNSASIDGLPAMPTV